MCCIFSFISPQSILLWISLVAAVTQAVEVKLVNSRYPNQGRVEIKVNGEWGTICDQDWDQKDASVICHQLGFESSIKALGGAAFGEGKGPIHYTEVQCNGRELNIASCKYRSDNRHGCNHGNDAGVICYHDDYPPKSVTPTQKPSPRKQGSTNWSDIIVSIVFPAAILFAIYLVYRRLYANETPPSTPNRTRRCSSQPRNTHRTEQYRVVPAPYGTMTDPYIPTDPDAPPPYDQVVSEQMKEAVPVTTVSRDAMDPAIAFTPTTPSDDDTIPYSADEDVRISSV